MEKLKELAKSLYFWIVAIIGFLAAYCYYLVQRNKSLETQLDMGEHRKEIEKYAEKLKQAKKESDDAVDNYKRVRDEYIASDEGGGDEK